MRATISKSFSCPDYMDRALEKISEGYELMGQEVGLSALIQEAISLLCSRYAKDIPECRAAHRYYEMNKDMLTHRKQLGGKEDAEVKETTKATPRPRNPKAA